MRSRTHRYAATLFIAWLAMLLPMLLSTAAVAETGGTIGLTITLHAPAERDSSARQPPSWQSSSSLVSLAGSPRAAEALSEVEKELREKYRPQQAAEMIDRMRRRMLVVSTSESPTVESLRPITLPVEGVAELRCERRTCESL